mmetsp:Transcript_44397/g.95302  ORF Transcript_44397/g.95302 Transcript_44397/m.95302 type:complete len:104 (+) Transcript_44397:375-686(+)
MAPDAAVATPPETSPPTMAAGRLLPGFSSSPTPAIPARTAGLHPFLIDAQATDGVWSWTTATATATVPSAAPAGGAAATTDGLHPLYFSSLILSAHYLELRCG